MEQALRATPRGLELILMADLKERLDEPLKKQEKDLAMALADRGLVNMTDYFLSSIQYWGAGGWTWIMQRDGRQVMGRGYYILSTDSGSFVNAGLQDKYHGTDHRLILAVLRVEGALRNRRFQQGRTRWPIRPKEVRPQTKG